MPISLHIKSPGTGPKFTVQIETLSITVAEFKVILQEQSQITPDQQRLIYRGHVLKDGQTLTSYALEEGHTVHLVKGQAPAPATTPSGGSATASSAGAAAPTAAATAGPAPFGFGAAQPTSNPFGSGGGLFGGGLGGFGMPPANMAQMQQQMMQNPDMMRDMMNSPAMQGLMQNPDLIRTVIMNNPQLREMIERNPEVGHVLNDPATFRQTMELARNPELMREMMRTTDRAMSNIESHPEGFNALRRMYQNVQEPLMDATSGAAQPAETSSGSPPAATGQPLPNPWGSPTPAQPAAAPAGGAGAAGAGLGGLGGMDLNALLGGLGGGAGLGGMGGMGGLNELAGMDPMMAGLNPEMMQQMLGNPAVQQMMQQMMQNPEMLQQMMAANPMAQQMMQRNPQAAAMLQNPAMLQQALNPANIQAMLQIQQGLNQLGAAGLAPPPTALGFNPWAAPAAGTGAAPASPWGAAPASANPSGAAAFDPAQLQRMFQNLGMGAGAGPAAPALAPPEERFRVQIDKLVEMGFPDRAANAVALSATGGNIDAAIDRLLSGM